MPLKVAFKYIRSLSFDAKKKDKQFKTPSAAERDFYRQLKKIATASGHIVEAHAEGASLKDEQEMMRQLDNYSKLITPWARRQSEKLLKQVSVKSAKAYSKNSKLMAEMLKTKVAEDAVGDVARVLLEEQVALIKSIPLEAGKRAQKIAADNFLQGRRAQPDKGLVDKFFAERRSQVASGDLEEEMERSTEVAVNRAKLIARTETARANSAFVEARASSLGVTSYIWRTTMDGAERDSHRRMNGEVIQYSKPPTLSDGTTGHAGTFPNCRCYQDPVLPDY